MPAPGQQHGMHGISNEPAPRIVDIIRVITMLPISAAKAYDSGRRFPCASRLHEGDAPGLLINALIHGGPLDRDQNQGVRDSKDERHAPRQSVRSLPSTVTVGFGFAPNLLTAGPRQALAA